MKDNHIRVTLEFIPVEERLPEEEEDCSGLYAVLRKDGYGFDILWFHNAADDGNRWETQMLDEIARDVIYWAEIPWAEIPEIAKEGE